MAINIDDVNALNSWANNEDANGTTATLTANITLTEGITIHSEQRLVIPKAKKLTIPELNSTVIWGTTSLELLNNGYIENYGDLIINGGKLGNEVFASIINVVSSSIINKGGAIINEGTITNGGGAIINDGGIINNKDTITNEGTINNGGEISNDGGIINNNGYLDTDGEINNGGKINNNGGEINNNGGTITNHENLPSHTAIYNYSTINNGGTLESRGTITNQNICEIKNDGGLINNEEGGTIINGNYFDSENPAKLDNDKGKIINNEGSVMKNYGEIYNVEGTITNNYYGGPFINEGTITNGAGSQITHTIKEECEEENTAIYKNCELKSNGDEIDETYAAVKAVTCSKDNKATVKMSSTDFFNLLSLAKSKCNEGN